MNIFWFPKEPSVHESRLKFTVVQITLGNCFADLENCFLLVGAAFMNKPVVFC